MKNKNKLGHQAPKNCRINRFNSIEINGEFAYCKSHNFVYNVEVEKEKLYNGKPCYYTDIRFADGKYNYYNNCMLRYNRFQDFSLKACIRKVLRTKGIPVDTIINFNKSWFYRKKKIDNSFKFKIKKEIINDIEYQINDPIYFNNFTNCNFSQELTNELRKNGFIVGVMKNESFLKNMINTTIQYSGDHNLIDSVIDGEIAIAYGYGKIIGFSSLTNDFKGYSNGCNNILWDKFGEFCKWSRCNEISKNTSVSEIIKILKV